MKLKNINLLSLIIALCCLAISAIFPQTLPYCITITLIAVFTAVFLDPDNEK